VFFILSATVFVAGITSNASAVDVGRIALVSLVHIGLGVTSTIRARKRRIGRGTRMAGRAKAARIVVIHVPKIVSKRRPKPIGSQGCVARRASGWGDPDDGGVGGEVVRHGPPHRLGALPLSGCNVRAGQGETCRAVVKDRARPGSRCMARVARLWIREGHMVWSWRNKDRGSGA
jgi:hypothetical protein